MAMPLPARREPPAAIQRLYAAHADAAAFYRAQLIRHHGPADYLRSRGLEAVVDRAAPWQIGYAPRSWTALTTHLTGRGFRETELVAAGLAFRGRDGRVFDLFRGRIVFPIRNQDGHIVAFTGRLWQPATATDPESPKYLNSPETPAYVKSRELFGLYEQRDRTGAGWPPVLVEGPADALAVWLTYPRTGRTGLVGLAPCGTALTETQLATAVALPGARRFGVAVAFDGDQAGHKAADRAYELLRAHPEILARGATFAPGIDCAQLLQEPDGRARLRTILERRAQPLLHTLIDHHLDRMIQRTPQLLHEIPGRLAVARVLAPLIAERPPAAAVKALRHLGETVEHLTEGRADAPDTVSAVLRCTVMAVADHLETALPRLLPDRSAARTAPEAPLSCRRISRTPRTPGRLKECRSRHRQRPERECGPGSPALIATKPVAPGTAKQATRSLSPRNGVAAGGVARGSLTDGNDAANPGLRVSPSWIPPGSAVLAGKNAPPDDADEATRRPSPSSHRHRQPKAETRNEPDDFAAESGCRVGCAPRRGRAPHGVRGRDVRRGRIRRPS
jgi:DNA primase catalytic core